MNATLKISVFFILIGIMNFSYGKDICDYSSSEEVLSYLNGIKKYYYRDSNIGNIFFILSEWKNPKQKCPNLVDDRVQMMATKYMIKLLRSGFYCQDIFNINDRVDYFYKKYKYSKNQEYLVELSILYILMGDEYHIDKIKNLFYGIRNKDFIAINLPKMCLESNSKIYEIFDLKDSISYEYKATFDRHYALRERRRSCAKLAQQRLEQCGSVNFIK